MEIAKALKHENLYHYKEFEHPKKAQTLDWTQGSVFSFFSIGTKKQYFNIWTLVSPSAN